jgi:outer membrane biosynthesis protein TonB
MKGERTGGGRADGRLWAIALGLSLLGNALIVLVTGFLVYRSYEFQKNRPIAQAPSEKTTVMILPPEMVRPESAPEPAAETPPVPPPAAAMPPEFARTSEDQRGKRPDRPAFMGERDTEATSDRTPDPTAPPLPSQAGVKPRDASDIETTESDYQDGTLEHDQAATAEMAPAEPTPPSVPPAEASPETQPVEENPALEGTDAQKTLPAARETALDGPNPIEVPVPKNQPEEAIKPTPEKPPAPKKPAVAQEETPPQKPAQPVKSNEPGFRGYQRKTAIQGSISRTGRSSLDVVDSPLGRYQAAISRAVEKEWQRNCVRHRDFITPGFLTVRFFVQPSGKVRSVQFVGDIETGEIQKGFTLNSIRDAEIPPMPAAVRQEFENESLELIFNFYF